MPSILAKERGPCKEKEYFYRSQGWRERETWKDNLTNEQQATHIKPKTNPNAEGCRSLRQGQKFAQLMANHQQRSREVSKYHWDRSGGVSPSDSMTNGNEVRAGVGRTNKWKSKKFMKVKISMMMGKLMEKVANYDLEKISQLKQINCNSCSYSY